MNQNHFIPPELSIAFYFQHILKTDRAHTVQLKIRAYDFIRAQIKRNKKHKFLINAVEGGLVFVRRVLPNPTKFVNLVDAMCGVYQHSQSTMMFDSSYSKMMRERTWKWEWKHSTYAYIEKPDYINTCHDFNKNEHLSIHEPISDIQIVWSIDEWLFFELAANNIKNEYKASVRKEIEKLISNEK